MPTLQLSHLSPTQKRAYILADNRLAEKAGWDKEILSVELQRLLDDGFEVVLTGFEVPDVDVVLDAAADTQSDPLGDDLIPDPGSAVSRPVTSGGWGLTGSSVAVRSPPTFSSAVDADIVIATSLSISSSSWNTETISS